MVMRTLLSLLLLCAHLLSPALAGGLPSVALYYGEKPPLAELRAFDVAVVDPDHVTAPVLLRHPASELFAYLSLGEVQPGRTWFKEIPPRLLVGENRAWGSRLIDPADPAWADFVTDRIVAPLWAQGYRGFFLDTLDSYQRFALTPEARASREAGLARVIRAIRTRWPEARLIMNRGFEILPAVHDAIWMVAAESLYRGWDPARRRYVEVPEGDRQWLRGQLDNVRNTWGKPVLVIDYVSPGQRTLARETARRLREEGFIPWVSTPALDQLGVGLVEVLPRRVLVLYNPEESQDLHYSEVLRFLGAPLAWLGLTPDYVPVNGPLPAYPLSGRYAGIISWINSDEVGNAAPYADWLTTQVEAGIPLAVFSRFGLDYDAPLLRRLGLQVQEMDRASTYKVTSQSSIAGFELAALTRPGDTFPLRLQGMGQPLVTLTSSAG